jgi:4-hydroxybenzoate polyprenyltransferase
MSENDDHTTAAHSTPDTGEADALSRFSAMLGRFWAGFKYSSLYIAVSAMVEVAIAMVLLGVSLNPAPLVVGLVMFSVYTNDRIADAETDAISDPEKAAFVQRYEHLLEPIADVAYGLAVMIAIAGGPLALFLTFFPGVFWIFYASGWLDAFDGSLSRLKAVLVLNTTVVALAWAIVLTFLPVAFAGASLSPVVLFVFAYFFLRVFTFVELSNIPDTEGDRQIGVSTIPTVFGIRGTRHALYLLNGLTGAIVLGALQSGLTPLPVAGVLLLGTGYSLGVAALVGRWANISVLIQAAEGEYVLTYLALLATMLVV